MLSKLLFIERDGERCCLLLKCNSAIPLDILDPATSKLKVRSRNLFEGSKHCFRQRHRPCPKIIIYLYGYIFVEIEVNLSTVVT